MAELSHKERCLAAVASCAAKNAQQELSTAIVESLDAGVTVNELKEVLVQLYAYCGFPRSLNALQTLRKVVVDLRGEKDPLGKEASPFEREGMLEQGAARQSQLIGKDVKGKLFAFVPTIDEYLKSHLFGDIFARDILDWRTREIVTVAMLAARAGVEPQLKGHIGIAKHNGVDEEQIDEIIRIARKGAGIHTSPFSVGEENKEFAQYFTGASWRAGLADGLFNVTFEPGCRNAWHRHSVKQVLIGVGGSGWYQERGKVAVRILPGTVIEVPQGVEHWHGADPKSWFSHLAMAQGVETTWLEALSEEEYLAAVAGSQK